MRREFLLTTCSSGPAARDARPLTTTPQPRQWRAAKSPQSPLVARLFKA
jgi:hypothetical protein